MVRALLLLVGVAAAMPAVAQDFSMPPISPSNIASVARTDVLGTHLRGTEQNGADLAASTVPSATRVASLRYLPSPQRRAANLALFVQKTRRTNPASAAAMEKLFASTDIIEAIGQQLAPIGLRTDDVSDAYAVWWMSLWGAAHGDSRTPSRSTVQAVRAQAARALASTSELERVDDATKQEMAEALLVQTALIDGMVEEYGRDPTIRAKIASAVRQGARVSGLNLDAMRLTEAGFVQAKLEDQNRSQESALDRSKADIRLGKMLRPELSR